MPNGMVKLRSLLQQGRWFLPLIVIASAFMLVVNELAYREACNELNNLSRLRAARTQLLRVVQHVTDAETAQRGYIITARREHVDPYRFAAAEARNAFETLCKGFTELGWSQAERLCQRLEVGVNARLDTLDARYALIEGKQLTQERAMEFISIGRVQMERVRAIANELLEMQNDVISVRRGNVFNTLQLGRIGIGAMTLISLLLLFQFRRQSRQLDEQRAAQEQAVKNERDQLEVLVRHRTAELTELAGHLQRAREDERARLARDLHDELGALLTAAKLDVAQLRSALHSRSEALSSKLAHLNGALDAGIALKRRIVEDLHPSTLDNLGLCPALEILCQEYAVHTGTRIDVCLESVRLSRSAQLTVFRVVQEALTNITKYAKANRVDVSLCEEGNTARVCISDDGAGFDPVRIRRANHGLRGMRLRVEAEHGSFHIASAHKAGTIVEAVLPLELAPISQDSQGAWQTLPSGSASGSQ